MPTDEPPVPESGRKAEHESARTAKRIVVAGNDGSGKTTLCRQLSARLGIPYTELDALKFGPDWSVLPGFVKDVTELARRPEWITEWDFDDARELLGARAELFVWIDLPRWRNAERALLRSVRARFSGESLWGSNSEPPLHTILTNRWHSVRLAIHNHEHSRQLASTFIRDHPEVASVHLRSPREVAKFRTEVSR